MAAGPITQVADLVVPEIFTPYIQQFTEEKSALVTSGVLERNSQIDDLLDGGGLTFNVPSFLDLDAENDPDNIVTDDASDSFRMTSAGNITTFGVTTAFSDAIPAKLETATEIAVRLFRHKSWSSATLGKELAGADPMVTVTTRGAKYWERRLQRIFIATMQGVSKDNGVNDAGDYAHSVAGATFVDGVTNFSTEAFLDAAVTMGDSAQNLSAIMVHSVVFTRMQKNNLIDFLKDSENSQIEIPVFQGRRVIVDDGMPSGTNTVLKDGTAGNAGTYETWLFGPGAMQWGVGSPDEPVEAERKASAGNGGGQDILHNRQIWTLHPVGHAFTAGGTTGKGGPDNTANPSNLNVATSWNRVYNERKQIPFARLITREHA